MDDNSINERCKNALKTAKNKIMDGISDVFDIVTYLESQLIITDIDAANIDVSFIAVNV